MKNRTGNNGGLFSRSITAGLVLLLVLAGLPGWQTGWPPTAAARKIELDWPQVQAVKPGTPITVLLHKDQGLRGKRKVRGRFHSATDDSLTLTMEYGTTRTLPMSAVRGVLFYGIKLGWSPVQAVKPGTPTTVLLYKDQAPKGSRKIQGRFQSATGDSLTLERKDGQKRTLSKSAVRKVLVHRPLGKRYAVWIALLVSTVIFGPSLYRSEDFTVVDAGKFIGIPTGLAFLAAPKKSEIYHVPPKYRMQPPADKPSGAKSKAPGKQGDSQ